MTSNLILRPNTELSSEVFTKKTSLIARGLNEISLLKPSPESLYQTGMDYYEGSNGKPWDILKAYAYLVKSAEQGFVLAQWRLSHMFSGVFSEDAALEKNKEKKEYWLEKAALNGHLAAMYRRLSHSSETYIEELTHLAESGCIDALAMLTNEYVTDKKDMQQAWYWVKQEVEQSSLSANFLYYFRSYHTADIWDEVNKGSSLTAEFWDEVDRDVGYWLREDELCSERYSATEREQYYENRMIWLLEKAQQGEAFAQFGLGREFSDINHNLEFASFCGTLFSENWQLVICEELLHQQATIAADEPIDWGKLAMFWLTKAAEQGSWAAQQSLGEVYANGKLGVGIDYKKALYWHRKAAELNFNLYYFRTILAFNSTDRADAPKFTFEELEHYRLNNQDSI